MSLLPQLSSARLMVRVGCIAAALLLPAASTVGAAQSSQDPPAGLPDSVPSVLAGVAVTWLEARLPDFVEECERILAESLKEAGLVEATRTLQTSELEVLLKAPAGQAGPPSVQGAKMIFHSDKIVLTGTIPLGSTSAEVSVWMTLSLLGERAVVDLIQMRVGELSLPPDYLKLVAGSINEAIELRPQHVRILELEFEPDRLTASIRSL